MKSILKIGTLVYSFLLLITACSSGKEDESLFFPYTYSFVEGRNDEILCSTGEITSHSDLQLCKNLLDNPLNGMCAFQQRHKLYESNDCALKLGIAHND